NAGKEDGCSSRSGWHSAKVRAGIGSRVFYRMRLEAGGSSFGHARRSKNKPSVAFPARHRCDRPDSLSSQTAVVGRLPAEQTTSEGGKLMSSASVPTAGRTTARQGSKAGRSSLFALFAAVADCE